MAYVQSTAGSTWYYWADATTSTSTITTTTNVIWDAWAGGTSTTTTSTGGPWVYWTSTGTHVAQQVPRQLTTEQIREQKEQNERWQKQAEEERKKRLAAEARAKELLEANLVLEERVRLSKEGHIFVKGRSGCRFRIRKGRSGNVDVVNAKGHITHRLCAHPAEQVPDYDTMLAQKLALETDDENFMRLANRHEHHGGPGQVMPELH